MGVITPGARGPAGAAGSSGSAGAPGGMGPILFGDRSDGVVVFDGTTTILGMVPSGSEYKATRHLFLDGGSTVNVGVKLNMTGFYVCTRILGGVGLVNNGVIHNNGGDGVTAVSNLQPAGGLAAGNGYYGNAGAAGRPGQNGASIAGANNVGPTWPGLTVGATAGTTGVGATGGVGGGGSGGGEAGFAGGNSGTMQATSDVKLGSPHDFDQRRRGRGEAVSASGGATTTANWGAGTSGGAGTCASLQSWSGGSGAPGGIIGVFAELYTGTGTIEARGGKAGDSFHTPPNSGAVHGSGGGGGGIAIVVVGPGSTTPTVSVAGGAGGIGANGGNNGGAGGDGLKYVDQL